MEREEILSTKEDVEKFIRWLADPKFRQLFETFVKTANNPEEKFKFESDFSLIRGEKENFIQLDFSGDRPAQNDEYERHIPLKVDPTTQQVYIRPDRGFSIVTRTRNYKDYKFDNEQPLIINVCHHKAIEPAQLIPRHGNCGHDHAHIPDHKHGGNEDIYKVPYSLAPPIKLPYRNETAKVYDCVFSSKTYQEFKNDDKKKTVLIDTALKAVKEQFAENTLKDVDYFEDVKLEPKKNTEIMRSVPKFHPAESIFEKHPINRTITPPISDDDRNLIRKTLHESLTGNNQFSAVIQSVPPIVIRQLDSIIQIRIDTSSAKQFITQIDSNVLEIQLVSDRLVRLILELSHPIEADGSYWLSKKDCIVIVLRKTEPILWDRLIKL